MNYYTRFDMPYCENTTEPLCETLNPTMTCDFFVHNTGVWPSTNVDTVLDNDFYALLDDFCNGNLSCTCYRERLFDLMQLAILGNFSNYKLHLVDSCINKKINGYDVVYNYLNCNVSDLMLLLGEAYERLGLADSALTAYYYILTNSHNLADTTLARWRVLNIEALQADTTFGSVYDSLMSLYYQRVDRDITATYQGVSPPYGRIVLNEQGEKPPIQQQEIKDEETVLAELEQNAPNPFTNETVIVFRLNREADVRLGIHDALGQTIKEVVNQRLRKGKYVYTFQDEGRAAGVYLYMLTTDGKQIVKKMQLIK